MYREDESGSSFMLGMMTGAFIGAGIALLLAPKSGQEIREQLGDQYRGLADRVGETTQGLRESAASLADQGRERVQDLSNQLSDRMSSPGERPAERAGAPGDPTPSSYPAL